jgi:hypothetical protein
MLYNIFLLFIQCKPVKKLFSKTMQKNQYSMHNKVILQENRIRFEAFVFSNRPRINTCNRYTSKY